MNKHTPGFWFTTSCSNGGKLVVAGDPAIAGFSVQMLNPADANLISAAPELLSALKDAVNKMREIYGTHANQLIPDKWLQAISKAETVEP